MNLLEFIGPDKHIIEIKGKELILQLLDSKRNSMDLDQNKNGLLLGMITFGE